MKAIPLNSPWFHPSYLLNIKFRRQDANAVKHNWTKNKPKGRIIWGFPKMVVPNNHGVFPLKTIILGCFGGIPIFGNTHMLPVKIQGSDLCHTLFFSESLHSQKKYSKRFWQTSSFSDVSYQWVTSRSDPTSKGDRRRFSQWISSWWLNQPIWKIC